MALSLSRAVRQVPSGTEAWTFQVSGFGGVVVATLPAFLPTFHVPCPLGRWTVGGRE